MRLPAQVPEMRAFGGLAHESALRLVLLRRHRAAKKAAV
jgi:hypothetical protein